MCVGRCDFNRNVARFAKSKILEICARIKHKIGAVHNSNAFAQVYLLSWNPKTKTLSTTDYPPLPAPCAYSQAAMIGNKVYVVGGQTGNAVSLMICSIDSRDVTLKMLTSATSAW